MAGISSKAMGKLDNKYKFNDGTELNSTFDIGLYETPFRLYDPQIGRFIQIDELAEGFDEWSPYTFALNNPILINDPTGLDTLTRKTNLDPVVVVGRTSTYRLYLNRLRLGQEIGVGRPVYYASDNENIKNRVEQWYNWQRRRTEMNHEIGMTGVEGASWLIPGGAILKVLRVKKALALLKLKRGKAAAEAVEQSLDDALELGGNVADDAANAGTQSLVKTSVEISGHAATQMAERGITEKMVEMGLSKGLKYWDPKNKSINYVLKNAFASGKDLLVGTNPLSGKVTTVIRGTNLTSKRLIPIQ